MKMNFTDRTVKGLKYKEAGPNRYTDESGQPPNFQLRIGKTGTKSFYLYFRVNGIQLYEKIGKYPQISLADAKDKAWEFLKAVEKGEVPSDRNKKNFGYLVDEYLEHHAKPNKSAGSYKEDKRRAEKFLYVWNDRVYSEIGRKDVVALFDKVRKQNGPVEANRLISLISVIFSKAFKRGIEVANPAARFDKSRELPRDRVLCEEEIKKVWNTIERLPSDYDPIYAVYMKVLFLTGQRANETRLCKWSDLDPDLTEWKKLNRENIKNRSIHILPVVGMFKEILEGLERKSEWVFPSPTNQDECFNNHYKAFAWVKKNSEVEHFTTHDIRRTFGHHISKLRIPKDDKMKLLNHIQNGVTATVYDWYDGFDEKKEALEKWNERLLEIVSTDQPTLQVAS